LRADWPNPEGRLVSVRFAVAVASTDLDIKGEVRKMEEQSVPSSSNPNDYAYAVKVEDNEVFMLKEQLDEKCRLARRMQKELDIIRTEQNALRDRIFLRLDDLYPGLTSLYPDGGVGIREWKDDLWYVAWGSQKQ
jgi:hypothetical protein